MANAYPELQSLAFQRTSVAMADVVKALGATGSADSEPSADEMTSFPSMYHQAVNLIT